MAIVTGTNGNDTLVIGTGFEDDALFGLAGNDLLDSGFGNDTLDGGSGDDVLQGGPGVDTLDGGTGHDFLDGGPGWDLIIGGDGFDTVSFLTDPLNGGVLVELKLDHGLAVNLVTAEEDQLRGIENIWGSSSDDILLGDANPNQITGWDGNDIIDGGAGDDVLSGVAGNDTISGGAGDDTLGGGAEFGDDTLDGGDGNDRLFGATGSDILTGGSGNDFLSGGEAGDWIDGGDGLDTVSFFGETIGISVDISAGDATGEHFGQAIPHNWGGNNLLIDDLFNVENLIGTSFGDIMAGDVLDNRIEGLDGNDSLLGRAGDDTLLGGDGEDVLSGGDGADILDGGAGDDFDILDGGDGIDTASYLSSTAGVFASLGVGEIGSFSNPQVRDRVFGIENVIGSNFGDSLTGDANANALIGAEGNDSLAGMGGNDELIGGFGTDVAVYFENSAFYSVTQNANGSWNVVDIRSGSPDGTDTLASIERIQFHDKSFYIGAESSNNFPATGAPEVFIGGAGQDTVSYADAPINLGFAATLASAPTTAGNGLVASLADPSTNTGWAAGDTYVSIENLIGSAGGDKLSGDNNNNVLEGGLGNDQLNGGQGLDTASYEHAANAVIADLSQSKNNAGEALGDTYTSIENLLGSSFADQLVGSDGINVLTGGDGNDTLFGKSGNDQLIGGAGGDTLKGGAGKDQFIQLSSGDGVDRIQDFDVKNDTLVFSASGFGNVLQAGQQLIAGTTFIADNAPTATTTAGTFLFDIDDHDLFWDADGSTVGGIAPQKVVHFDTAVNLKADDFTIMA